MAYLTKDEFETLSGGSAVTAFDLYEAKAEQLINRLTHGRIRDDEIVRDAVKYCIVELINAMCAADQHDGREVASISNDGVSVSYATATGNGSSETHRRYLQIVREWLSGETTEDGVPLLYAGVDA